MQVFQRAQRSSERFYFVVFEWDLSVLMQNVMSENPPTFHLLQDTVLVVIPEKTFKATTVRFHSI